MNSLILVAAILCILLGVVHSVLGEYLIFKNKRLPGRIVPTKTQQGVRESHLRIIWATWHLVSVFGWGIGAFLLKFALDLNESHINETFLIPVVITVMIISSILVAVATKGKHPGWVVLLLIAILLFI